MSDIFRGKSAKQMADESKKLLLEIAEKVADSVDSSLYSEKEIAKALAEPNPPTVDGLMTRGEDGLWRFITPDQIN